MGKIVGIVFGSIIGGLAVVGVIAAFSGFGMPAEGQQIHLDATRSDYVDLLLTLVTIFLGAIGLTVTVGAVAIALVALKTLREIKDEAVDGAKKAAAAKIVETLNDETLHAALTNLAREGELDDVTGRVLTRLQGGPEDVDDPGEQA